MIDIIILVMRCLNEKLEQTYAYRVELNWRGLIFGTLAS